MTFNAPASRGLFGYGCGVFAGVASALILAFALSHSGSVLVLAAYLASTPLFMAGFGAGAGPGLLAALVGAAGLFAATPASFGSFYLFADAVPASVLILLALRRRAAPGGGLEWAAEGDLLATLAIYPCLLFIAAYVATMGHEGGLLAMTTEAFEGMAGQVTAALTENGQTVTPDVALKIHQYLDTIARVAPALAICAWLFSTLIAMIVAQGVIQQQGWNLRPPFALTRLHVPGWVVFAAAATGVVASFAPAPYDYVGLNLAVALGVPFFFAGLAVVHAFAAQTRWPAFVLIVFYAVICIIVYLAPLVALLGAVDQWADFRKRFADRAGR